VKEEGKKMQTLLKIAVGLAIIMILPHGVVWAEQTNYDIGKVGGSELKLGLGPRPVAMGEAFVAKADDVNGVAWNPAGLSQAKGSQIGFMHNLYVQETSLEYLAYTQSLFEGAGVGANVTYLNYGKFDKYNEVNGLPEAAGSFTPTLFTATLGYGQWLMPNLGVGASVKMISQSIDTETYSAVAADFGGLFKTGLDGLQLGLAVQNLGTKLADADLPLNAKVGAAYVLPVKFSANDIWNTVLDISVPFGDTKYTSVNIGTEYWYNQMVAARVGYKIKDTGDLGGITGFTAGAGVKLSMFTVDYALVSYGDLGLTHQIALGVGF
jgi:hypothetical protein